MKAKIPEILDFFSIKRYNSTLVVGCCKVHGGDNPTAFNINLNTSDEYCGRWFCNTHGCHRKYGGDILGLIWAMMNSLGPVSFKDVLDVASTLAGVERIDFVSDLFTDLILKNVNESFTGISKNDFRQRFKYPCRYYLERGFSEEVLDEFDVGYCDNVDDEMYCRAVFPIYDKSAKSIIGCIGRTTTDSKSKWKNGHGLKISEYLFGYWKSLKYVCQTGKIVLVEGQGDVMKLWQAGIKNSFGLFGSSLSASQELLIQQTGVTDIVTLFDNDEAGNKIRNKCTESFKRLFNVKHLLPSKQDVGEMEISSIQEIEKDLI